MAEKIQSAERVSAEDLSDNYVFQRSKLAYFEAAKIVSGNVLEIGTGSGYGISIISPHVKSFITVDKFACGIDPGKYPNVEFHQTKVPPLKNFESGTFDFVIIFQVIEHIKNDFAIISEIHRVLKEGGKLIITTPNKKMSLTRNPWHIREYTVDEFLNLTGCIFADVEAMGVFGNEKVMSYYAKNKESVQKFARYDIFRFQKWLPNFLLRIPYDILNRMNRRKLLKANEKLTSGIVMEDYFLAPADDSCFDLFFIARK